MARPSLTEAEIKTVIQPIADYIAELIEWDRTDPTFGDPTPALAEELIRKTFAVKQITRSRKAAA